VILHISYTARQGVDAAKVKAALDDLLQQASRSDLAILFSLRHDFPTEWSTFVSGAGDFSVKIRRDHFPYFAQAKTITIGGFDLYGQDITDHHAIARPPIGIDLTGPQEFTFTAGSSDGLTRSMTAEAFLIMRYSL
jgi:hypothetical protein